MMEIVLSWRVPSVGWCIFLFSPPFSWIKRSYQGKPRRLIDIDTESNGKLVEVYQRSVLTKRTFRAFFPNAVLSGLEYPPIQVLILHSLAAEVSSHIVHGVFAGKMKRVAPVVVRVTVFGVLKAPPLGPSEVGIRAACLGFDQWIGPLRPGNRNCYQRI